MDKNSDVTTTFSSYISARQKKKDRAMAAKNRANRVKRAPSGKKAPCAKCCQCGGCRGLLLK